VGFVISVAYCYHDLEVASPQEILSCVVEDFRQTSGRCHQLDLLLEFLLNSLALSRVLQADDLLSSGKLGFLLYYLNFSSNSNHFTTCLLIFRVKYIFIPCSLKTLFIYFSLLATPI